jgi:hypothetical protein
MTKEAAKENTKRSSREEDGHTETAFISATPEGNVDDDTGKMPPSPKPRTETKMLPKVFTITIKFVSKNRAPID